MKTANCPEDCIYRNKLVPFCGYCMRAIIKEREEKGDGTEQQKAAGSEQVGDSRSRYREKDHGTRFPGDYTHHTGTEDGNGGYGVDSGAADGNQKPPRHWVSY